MAGRSGSKGEPELAIDSVPVLTTVLSSSEETVQLSELDLRMISESEGAEMVLKCCRK